MTNTVSRIISDETLSRIIQVESGGNPKAKAPTSSAGGLGQFINGTWLATVAKHRPIWAQGLTNAELLPLRFHPKCAIEMLARFTEDNASALGGGWTDGDLYLAHFAGAGTAKLVMRSDPSRPASQVFNAAAIRANRSILEGKDCGTVRAWAQAVMKKSGGRNWVAVHWSGAPTVIPAKTKATAGAVVAGGAGTVAAASQSGLSAGGWALLAVGVAVIALVGFLVWKHFRDRNTAAHVDHLEVTT